MYIFAFFWVALVPFDSFWVILGLTSGRLGLFCVVLARFNLFWISLSLILGRFSLFRVSVDFLLDGFGLF